MSCPAKDRNYAPCRFSPDDVYCKHHIYLNEYKKQNDNQKETLPKLFKELKDQVKDLNIEALQEQLEITLDKKSVKTIIDFLIEIKNSTAPKSYYEMYKIIVGIEEIKTINFGNADKITELENIFESSKKFYEIFLGQMV